jgi:hypothetical protein
MGGPAVTAAAAAVQQQQQPPTPRGGGGALKKAKRAAAIGAGTDLRHSNHPTTQGQGCSLAVPQCSSSAGLF